MSINKIKSLNLSSAKRGDTLIEVMFAIAIFSLVAVLSIAMMNAGIASGERSLELVTARYELNAQAEAIRFIHSSYISELTLPACTTEILDKGEKCQQYSDLWHTITANAKKPHNSIDPDNPDNYNIPSPLDVCADVYRGGGESLLVKNNAFVINPRVLNSSTDTHAGSSTSAYVAAKSDNVSDGTNVTNETIFLPPPLNARLVYGRVDGVNENDRSLRGDPLNYVNLIRAEGIWVVAVEGQVENAASNLKGSYYDFYIQSCWYGSNTNSPTSLDTIIRLYNSEGSH